MTNVPGIETAKEAAARLARPMLAKGFKPEALHTYTDPDGQPIYHRIRVKHPETGEKWIRPMYRNGKGYELAEPRFDGKKPLYRLHELTRAADGTDVLVVEGEKPADALRKRGLLATTSGGADSARKADWSPLKRLKPVLWRDNDNAGENYQNEVMAELRAMGIAARAIDVATLGLPEKADAVEWLAEHPEASPAEVLALTAVEAPGSTKATTASDEYQKPRGAPESATAGVQPIEWPEPARLPDDLPPVEPFSFELLPSSVRPWIEDISDRVQCPPDFPAVGAMVALGSLLGRKLAIRPKVRDDWQEVGNLWGCVIGRPGVLKTPALSEVLRPLQRLEVKAAESFEDERARWERDIELGKLKREAEKDKARKALKDGLAVADDLLMVLKGQDEPKARRHIVNDCSYEALGEVLRANPNGVLAYRDELIGLLKVLDKEGHEAARSFYLSAWTGKEAHTFDRIGRGLNLRIGACCLSLLGSIQPGVIGEYLRDAVANAGGDGLLARFQLLVWPDIGGEWRNVDRWPDTGAKETAFDTFTYLKDLLPADAGAVLEAEALPFLRFDPAAQAMFNEWRETFERRLRNEEDHSALIAHFAKYRKLVPTLAIVTHVAERRRGPIGEEALLRALAWAEYLESHARRAYASVTQAEAIGAKALLGRIRNCALPSPFTLRDVYLKGWANLSTPDAARRAAAFLVELDYLREHQIDTGGRPKTEFDANPKGLR